MTFARWVFLVAGIYGCGTLIPQLFLEERVSRDFPPAVTHPEFYYGFVGTALAWQVAFLTVAWDPARYRPLIPAMLIEKWSFAAAILWLYLRHRVPGMLLVFGGIDVLLGLLFWEAYRRTKPPAVRKGEPAPKPSEADARMATIEDRPLIGAGDTELLILDLGRAIEQGPRSPS